MIQLVANGERLAKSIEEKKEDFKLIPLFSPINGVRLAITKNNPILYKVESEKILNCWDTITKGLESVIEFTTGDMSLAKILNELLSGELLLWLGFVDGKYRGFVTVRKDMNINARNFLSIIHLFIKPDTDKEIFLNGLSNLKQFAKEHGCQAIRFWSLRDGWKRKLIPMGFKQTYIEYTLELEGAK